MERWWKMVKTLDQILKNKVPKIIKEFEAASWDYRIYSPLSFKDLAIITFYLWIGKKKANKLYILHYNFLTQEVTVREGKILK